MAEAANSRVQTKSNQAGTLGTFTGVFVPSVMTILGIILFLRLGYITGGGGLGRTLLIIALANTISVFTSISLAAIATNMRVKKGGDYYLISRTLGLTFGGSIGIVLFLAQSISIGFYCIGFAEALTAMPSMAAVGIPPWVVAAISACFLFVFAWLGSDWASRFQLVVMAILIAALVSFFMGGLPDWSASRVMANWKTPAGAPPFWVLFALFFPAVTGFTQGVSMSGDLKDPGRSLPLGTFLAVGVSFLVYLAVAVVFSGNLSNAELVNDLSAMKHQARFGFLIDAGVIAATLSSAMASFLGAPRILQSLAADRVFPFLDPFARGAGPANNPRRGVLFSAVIALTTIGFGKLDLIAPVVSMFFLISYGLLNYATYFEAKAESPSFRPRFRWFHRRLSLLGFLACAGVMLAINLAVGIIAVSILFAIHQYLKRTAGPARWADSRRAYHLSRVRENLLAVAKEPEHDRDWRPQVLAFSRNPDRRQRLLTFASWLEGKSGFTTVVQVVEGDGIKALRDRDKSAVELRADLTRQGFSGFPLTVAVSDMETGLQTLLQSFGIGPLQANTVLLNWLDPESKEGTGLKSLHFGYYLRIARRLGRNIVVFNAMPEAWERLQSLPPEERNIDVWWSGDATSRLMLLFAYLMTRSREWNGATIRVLALAGNDNPDELEKALADARIEAKIGSVDPSAPYGDDNTVPDNTLLFLPIWLRNNQIESPCPDLVENQLPVLPVTAMMLAGEDIDLDAEPEEGEAAERAAVMDALDRAGKKLEKARQKEEAAQAEVAALLARKQELEISSSGACDLDGHQQLEKESGDAVKKLENAEKKAAKALAKKIDAEKTASDIGIESEQPTQEQSDPEDGDPPEKKE